MDASIKAPVFAAAPLKGLIKVESLANSWVGALVSEKLTPAINQKLVKDLSKMYDPKTGEFVVKQRRDIAKIFMTELSQGARDIAIETYVVSAVTACDGTINEKQLDRLGEAALRRDRELSASIENILRKKQESRTRGEGQSQIMAVRTMIGGPDFVMLCHIVAFRHWSVRAQGAN